MVGNARISYSEQFPKFKPSLDSVEVGIDAIYMYYFLSIWTARVYVRFLLLYQVGHTRSYSLPSQYCNLRPIILRWG